MLFDGVEDPIVRFYRIEYADEYHDILGFEKKLTPDMVRQRLGIPPRPCAVVRLFRYVAKKLHARHAAA